MIHNIVCVVPTHGGFIKRLLHVGLKGAICEQYRMHGALSVHANEITCKVWFM